MQMFDSIIVYVLEELTLSLHKGQREGQRDRYLDSMIIDGVHTENTEENGGPQADGVSGQQSPDTAKLMSTDEIGNERIIGQQ